MKKLNLRYLLILLVFTCMADSCKKQVVPAVTTSSVSDITGTSAVCGGTVTSQGSGDINERGICWSTASTPTIADYKSVSDADSVVFSDKLSDLSIATTYYVRAYATNKAGTGYGEIRSFTTFLADHDGNIYTTVTIGLQTWIVENLKTTKFNDGTAIPPAPAVTDWNNMKTPAFCWYNNDSQTYKPVYGALYNWYSVNSGKLCPAGWHVPSYSEWTALNNYLAEKGFGYGGSGDDTGKSLAAASLWLTSSEPGSVGNDLSGNNKTGFAGMPGGMFIEGRFYVLGETGGWWSSTVISGSSAAWSKQLNYSGTNFTDIAYFNHCSLSVRCLKD